ncbi:hypothetical protein GGR56DRAFT_612859 [Xylariaceae sp. FL0804]|nr:hypothetical protein GGR56DRAFT_612859 [Xylariaceae sp. FL0804]
MQALILLASLFAATVRANTEKAIFLGPPAVDVSSAHPALDGLEVFTLTPQRSALRTHLEAQFPGEEFPHGKATWLVLDGLTEGQRYEVRICWAATSPTAFNLNTYELHALLEKPELISGLGASSRSHQSNARDDKYTEVSAPVRFSGIYRQPSSETSLLFLQILAAADYYTTNKTLMTDVPPVRADIILDPFLFNILPRSLAPTVIYIIMVAVASWLLAQQVSAWIRQVAIEPSRERKSQ